MASEPILATFDLAVAKRSRFWDSGVWFDYFTASILYLPSVFLLMILSRLIAGGR